jgi:hypothetical protein
MSTSKRTFIKRRRSPPPAGSPQHGNAAHTSDDAIHGVASAPVDADFRRGLAISLDLRSIDENVENILTGDSEGAAYVFNIHAGNMLFEDDVRMDSTVDEVGDGIDAEAAGPVDWLVGAELTLGDLSEGRRLHGEMISNST